MEFRNKRETLLNQLKPRHGKPPDHAGRSTTFDNYSLDTWRNLWIDGATYQPVPLKLSQCGSQHVLGNARNGTAQFAKSVQPEAQQEENLQLPFAGQSSERVSDFNSQRIAIAAL